MRRLFYMLLIIFSIITPRMYSQSIEPSLTITTSGAVTDFVIGNNIIYAATDQGTIDIININNGNLIESISLPPAKDFMGDLIPSKVYSVDKLDEGLVFVWQGNHGFRNVSIYKNGEITKLIDADFDKLMIKKVRFIDKDEILLGLLSNELILFNINTRSIVYKTQISAYSFSDFSLNHNKTMVATTDESGIVHIVNVSNGNIDTTLQGNNVDNIYQVVFKNRVIITAGQDRRVGIYNLSHNMSYFMQEAFLVYCVGLSSDGTTGAFCASEESEINIFDIANKTVLSSLIGHSSTVNKIVFISNNTLITSAEEPTILLWKIK